MGVFSCVGPKGRVVSAGEGVRLDGEGQNTDQSLNNRDLIETFKVQYKKLREIARSCCSDQPSLHCVCAHPAWQAWSIVIKGVDPACKA